MFPIINTSKFFKTDSNIFSSKISKNYQNSSGGVFSQIFLRKYSCSDEFNYYDVLNAKLSDDKIYVTFEDKIIGLCSGAWDWVKSVQIAKDVHSFNVIIEKLDQFTMHVRTMRNIEIDEEIIAWFSDDILYTMGLTHLSPINIQGENRYVCHKCQRLFEDPNPLKTHIAADCESDTDKSMDLLWSRLSNGIKLATLPLRQSVSPDLVIPTPTLDLFPRRPSAFQPISKNIIDPIRAASTLETFVSNMGSSKRGNLCLYCGKLYSRKYGLKIHIRTHTGYKPLKCKYCDRMFGDPSNLNKHMRLHRESRSQNYSCHICKKNLIRKRDLQRHLQTQH